MTEILDKLAKQRRERKTVMADERRIPPDSFEVLTSDEKAAARRAQLYATHKARGTLDTYYQLYPDERPPSRDNRKARGDERGR